MSRPNVVLMSSGYQLIEGLDDQWTGTKLFFDAATRTDKASVTLPAPGDSWSDAIPGLICAFVDTRPIGEDTSAGFQYVCYYSTLITTPDILTSERTAPEVSVSVSTDAAFDTWSHDPAKQTKIYKTTNETDFTEIQDIVSLSRLTPQTNITMTQRYTGSISDLLASNASLVGKINNAEMWGIGIGNILFNGVNAVPVKTIVDGVSKIGWNRVYSYSVRYLPGIAAHAWQCVFVEGKYVRLSTSASAGGYTGMDPYEYATLPNPLA